MLYFKWPLQNRHRRLLTNADVDMVYTSYGKKFMSCSMTKRFLHYVNGDWSRIDVQTSTAMVKSQQFQRLRSSADSEELRFNVIGGNGSLTGTY
jgi:GH43 family beta-xylosidase